jgi:hypothetical protein
MRVFVLALVSTFALAAGPAMASVSGLGGRSEHRAQAWKWQLVMGKKRTPTRYGERRASRARRPPNRGAWLCIQRHEGSWSDGGAPYYGGLQMDISFQRAYGARLLRRKGTADNWTPLEQMWVAEKALRAGRGFYPWPNAARACGLI